MGTWRVWVESSRQEMKTPETCTAVCKPVLASCSGSHQFTWVCLKMMYTHQIAPFNGESEWTWWETSKFRGFYVQTNPPSHCVKFIFRLPIISTQECAVLSWSVWRLAPNVGVGVTPAVMRGLSLAFSVFARLCAVEASEEEPSETCSKALGFNESSGPKDRSFQDLTFCDEHHERTCCERNHTKQVRSLFAGFSHERSGRCAQMARLAFCSVCDGDVGTGSKAQENLVILCPSFCRLWFESCAEDFFAPGTAGAGSVAPCGPNALVCSPLSEITKDPAAFCQGAGFQVAELEDGDEPCYDGVPASKMRGKAPRAPWSPPKRKEPTIWSRAMDAWRRGSRGFINFLEDNAPGFAIAIVAATVAWNLVARGWSCNWSRWSQRKKSRKKQNVAAVVVEMHYGDLWGAVLWSLGGMVSFFQQNLCHVMQLN